MGKDKSKSKRVYKSTNSKSKNIDIATISGANLILIKEAERAIEEVEENGNILNKLFLL
ncbi:MAG: hypothetical protein KKG75_00150 [Nanoarchaeota archaeon]|nr:hypothetical protein [Nanoarchaeota archaeon]